MQSQTTYDNQDIQDRPGTQSTNKRHIQSHQERRMILNREYPEGDSKIFRSNSNLMKQRAGQLKLFGNQKPNGNNQPKVIPQDKERLYDEVMQAKQLINQQRSENQLLRTKNYSLEAEIRRQISTQYNSGFAIAPKNSEAYRGVMSELYGEDNSNAFHLAQLKEMKKTLKGRDETISRLSRTTNQTRMRELEIDNSNLSNETIRLQAMVTQALTLQQSQQFKNGNSEKVIGFLTNDNVQMAAILKEQGRQITTLTNQSAEKGALINRIHRKLEGQTKIMKELQRELDEMRQRDPHTSGGKKQNQHKAELEGLKNELDKKFNECNQLNNCVMKKDKRISELERRVKEVQLECQDKLDHLEQEKNQMKDKLVQNREEQLVSQNNIQVPMQKSKTNSNTRNSINLLHQASIIQSSPNQCQSPNKFKFELNQNSCIAQEDEEENEETHKMNVITKQDVQELGFTIKYRLLEMRITLDSLDSYTFQNKDENQMISIFNLQQNLQYQPFNLSKIKALLLARYLIENNDDNEIMFTNTRKQTLPRVRSILRNLLGGYELPTPQQEDQLKLQIANLLHKNKVGVITYISKLLTTLKQSFDPTSCQTTEIQEAFIASDIVFTQRQMDYLLQINYATTQNLSIINFNQLFISFPLANTIRPVSQKSSQGQTSKKDPIIQIELSFPDAVDNEEVPNHQFLQGPITQGSKQRKLSNQSNQSKQSNYSNLSKQSKQSRQSIKNSLQNSEHSINDTYISQ